MKINIDLRSLGYKPWSGVCYYAARLVKELLNYQVDWSFFDNRFKLNNQIKQLIGEYQFYSYQIPNKIFSPLERFLNWPLYENLVKNPDLI